MHLNEEKLKSLISNKFIIDCIQIVLTQQKEDDPIVYRGSGSIFQLADGNFQLKLYHIFNDFLKEVRPIQGKIKPGKIIGKEHYFSMKATDISGNLWESQDISVPKELTLPATGKVINTQISRLSNKQDITDKTVKNHGFLLVLPGTYSIPCNSLENLSSGGSLLNTCKIDILGVNLEIKNKKNCITVSAKDPSGKINESFHERLLEALSIIFGKINHVLYSSFSFGSTKTSLLSSIPTSFSNKSMVSPIKHNDRCDVEHFKEFIEKYIKNFTSENEIFFSYWHKINRAWQGGIENAALSLCVAIEGVTKNYYSEFNLPEADIVEQANEAIEIINKNTDIGIRIKKRILSNLGQVKALNSKNILYNLASENKFKKELADSWISLRNKSTHADSLKEGVEEYQKYIDEVFKCLNLFYVLLLLKIGFNGTYQDFAKDGWGESYLNSNSEAVEDENA